MCSSSDLMRFSGTKLQQIETSVLPLLFVQADGADVQMTDASVVIMSTSNFITVDNCATPTLLM